MLYRLVRPMRRSGSRIPYFQQRIPADVRGRAIGLRLDMPLGVESVPVAISAKTEVVKLSLRTADPAEAKVRQAALAGYLETVWRALREDSPLPLTHRQATALAGRLYRAWASGEGRERTTSVVIDRTSLARIMPDGGSMGDDESADNVPDFWESAKRHLDDVEAKDEAFRADSERRKASGQEPSDKPRPLERAFGPLIDRLLLREGIRRVDPGSREMLLTAFHLALKDAFEARQRNASGDYRPDPKAERFPAFERPKTKPSPSSSKSKPKDSLAGLLDDWWKEAKAGGRTVSTHESYQRTIRQLIAFLGRDDASAITADDVIRFKDHRVAQGVSLKTVRDSDIAALRSVFGWAVANRRIASNPADGVKLKSVKLTRTRSKGFSAEEAKALLRKASQYVAGNKRENAKTAAAKRWAPWLCAYTGARVGEIVQLRKQDVRVADGVWIINITPEAGTVKDKEAREVVLHTHLAELGFADFVQRSKPGYLFLNAELGDDIRGVWRAVKNRLADFARETVTDKRVAPNHGWRHCFKTIGREVGIEDSVLDGICGHAPSSVGGGYGAVSIAAQSRAFAMFPRFAVEEAR